MARVAIATCCATVAAALAVRAGAPSNAALCDALASRIRAEQALASGAEPGDPLTALSKGTQPFIEVASNPALALDGRDASTLAIFNERFRAEFAPGDDLRTAVDGFVEPGHNEVFSLPDSGLHVVVNTKGVVSCRRFLFFQTSAGGRSHVLPDVPRAGIDDDGVLCYNADGHLVRINGTEAFLELTGGLTNYHYRFRIVPWRDGQWSDGCSVGADFRSAYSVSHVFARPRGPLLASTMQDLAAALVEQWSEADDLASFHFGPSWPPGDDERAQALKQLGAGTGTVPVPTFEASASELGPFYRELDDPDSIPVFVNGRVFLAQVGHATIGWRVFQDAIVILYDMKDGRLSPVASAIVEQRQGALGSVRVDATR